MKDFSENSPNSPLVSIIIPAYDRADLIGETLDSVLAQTYPNWECIVVDDGSTDNTKEVVQQYADKDSRFILVDRPDTHKPGGNGARNFGIENVKGNYIIFIDSDDLLACNCLELRIKHFEKETHFDFLVFRTQYFFRKPGDCEYNIGRSPKYISDYLSEFLKYSLPWDTRGPIWKKSTLDSLNGFDEDLDRLQDVDLHTRALKSGKRFRYYNIADTYYRGYASEINFNPGYFNTKVLPSFLKYYQKSYESLELSYIGDIQTGIMVTFKKFFLTQGKQIKPLYAYISSLYNYGIITRKQRNVLNFLTLSYFLNLNQLLGSKNMIRFANKFYYKQI